MLSKPTGGTLLYVLSTTTGTATLTDWNGLPPRKVRVAVAGQSAVINFKNSPNYPADNNSDLLIPNGHVEHFTLESTNTCSYVVLSGATGSGYISFTPVA
jgi:hypothetical protein